MNHRAKPDMTVLPDLKDFDRDSGSMLERLIFNHRPWFILACVIVTILLAFQSSRLVVNASFDRMIPQSHPYIKNYFETRKDLGLAGNSIRIVVENTRGNIFDPQFLALTRQINDVLFLTPGVDRAWMKSIWMSSVRWTEVTEEGFRGGAVMPSSLDGAGSMRQLEENILRAGIVGILVSNDLRSIMLVAPLLERNPETGRRLDYQAFSRTLERDVRDRFEADGRLRIHIIGFAKLVGELIDDLARKVFYFALVVVVVTLIIFSHTRCARSTVLVVLCSLMAVLWEMGCIAALGIELDPYSILAPFIVFAIGMSHGMQKMNGILQDIGRGTHRVVAARHTFRRLFYIGVSALLADAAGFGVLTAIDIPVIKDMAVAAGVGVAMLIVTNLLLLPVLLSHFGVSPNAARRSLRIDSEQNRGSGLGALWDFLARFTERRRAIGAMATALLIAIAAFFVSLNLKMGDLDSGAPELRPDARYNRDSGFINASFGLSGDQFVVVVKTPEDGCSSYETLIEVDRLAWTLRQVPGVLRTTALSDNVMQTVSGLAEGNPKWLSIPRNEQLLGGAVHWNLTDNPDVVDKACSVIPVTAYLADHKAETLARVVAAVEQFALRHDVKERRILLAAGPAGIDAVTNMVVRRANPAMLLYTYGAIMLLCFLSFHSWRVVVVAILPLMLTSILCEALMVMLGIGIKVATLPVIVLGVGLGVDYALYLLSIQLAQQRAGQTLRTAYRAALQFTGKVVVLVSVMLAAGVVTWAWSPTKFQADIGVLLAFMLLLNMIGALVLTPALSSFLLDNTGSRQLDVNGADTDLPRSA